MTNVEYQALLNGVSAEAHQPAASPGAVDDSAEPFTSKPELLRDSSQRRVTFSDDPVVHQLPVRSTSSGDEGNWPDVESAAGSTPAQPLGYWGAFKQRVKALKRDITALYYAVHHPDTPWYCKLLPWLVLAYALSPLDLIPDFIPVLGILDDMILLPIGLWLSYRLIPAQVMSECRERANTEPLLLHKNWLVATLVFLLWTSGLLFLVHWLLVTYGDDELQQYEWVALVGCGAVVSLMFVAWLVGRIRYERRRREEWNVSLLSAAPDDTEVHSAEGNV